MDRPISLRCSGNIRPTAPQASRRRCGVSAPTSPSVHSVLSLSLGSGPGARDVRPICTRRPRGLVEILLSRFKERMAVLRAYGTLGAHGDADFMLWIDDRRTRGLSESSDPRCSTRRWRPPRLPLLLYIAMTRRSHYVDKHASTTTARQRAGILACPPAEPQVLLRVPDGQKRPWYPAWHEERQAAMDEHVRVSHDFRRVKINRATRSASKRTEFVVAFRSRLPGRFLRPGRDACAAASRARPPQRETPIFTCRSPARLRRGLGAARVLRQARSMTGVERMLAACRRQPVDATPVWLHAPAGRMFAGYRALREQYPILTLAKTPELSSRITAHAGGRARRRRCRPVRRQSCCHWSRWSVSLEIQPDLGRSSMRRFATWPACSSSARSMPRRGVPLCWRRSAGLRTERRRWPRRHHRLLRAPFTCAPPDRGPSFTRLRPRQGAADA